MGLHSPFGYVGYETAMAELMIMLLEKLCGGCHTNDDYEEGCKQCPAGQLIYELRDYLLDTNEADKRYAMYVSDECQTKRKEYYGHEDSQEVKDKWLALAKSCKPEFDIIRKIKKEINHIEPHPSFYAQWIFEDSRKPDPLLKLRELVKDLAFIQSNRFRGWKFQGEYETQAKLRMREELEPLLLEEEKEVNIENRNSHRNP